MISRHLRNVFKDEELERSAAVANYATAQVEGDRTVNRLVEFFNLDAIISVGYRVNSKRGTQFRTWATRVLRDHVLKGFSVNQNRLRDLNQTVRLVAAVIDRVIAVLGSEAAPPAGWYRVFRQQKNATHRAIRRFEWLLGRDGRCRI